LANCGTVKSSCVPEGVVADHQGPEGAFVVLAALTFVAIAFSLMLREPRSHPAA